MPPFNLLIYNFSSKIVKTNMDINMEMDASESMGMFNIDPMTDFINTCQKIYNVSDFCSHIYPAIKRVLPHRMFAFGTASVDDLNTLKFANITFPAAYVEKTRSMVCPALLEWAQLQNPVHLNRKTPLLRSNNRSWFKQFTRYKIESLTMHGVMDSSKKNIYFFVFGGINSWTKREELILQLIVPQLYCSLISQNNFFNKTAQTRTILTPREEQVLKLICEGKSNAEAAEILYISPWTVKIHVGNLLAKLKVSNRSHAVVKAMNLGLLTT